MLWRLNVKHLGPRPVHSGPPVKGGLTITFIQSGTGYRTKPLLLWGFLLQLNLILANALALRINSPRLLGKESKVTSPKLPTHGLASKPGLYFSKITTALSANILGTLLTASFPSPYKKSCVSQFWPEGRKQKCQRCVLKMRGGALPSFCTVFLTFLAPNV